MPAVRLGRMVLNWCLNCNIPILISKKCSNCGSDTKIVQHTPPGDIRPAFKFDIQLVKEIMNSQFGEECGDSFIPNDRVVLLNRAPDLDRLDEIIFDGEVQGALKFYLSKQKFKFLPRLSGAKKILDFISTGYIKMDDGAIKPIMKGSNALAPGVVQVVDGIKSGDEVLVLNERGGLLGVGTAHMSSNEMLKKNHGLAVKIRWHIKDQDLHSNKEIKIKNKLDIGIENKTEKKQILVKQQRQEKVKEKEELPIRETSGWELTIKANQPQIDKMIHEAKNFIHSTINKYNLPVAVSFSGGKDSLATLLLVLDSDVKPILLFVDTGLEFPETLENVNRISKSYNLDLLIGKPSNTFWDGLEYFGPPGKDYRWCCKTCKLGPTTKVIKKNFPGGILAFIGQRRYESEQRAAQGKIWQNPWVPGQVGASPIQDWSALHIWLYLFRENADYNVLYEQGLERIGCWLCPASDMADFELVSSKHPDFNKLLKELNKYSKLNQYNPIWITYGLWRWKKPSKGIEQLISNNKIILKSEVKKRPDEKVENEFFNDTSVDIEREQKFEDKSRGLNLYIASEFIDCKYGFSKEGVYNKKLDMDRIYNLLNILGKPSYNKSYRYCTLDDVIDVYFDGGIVVKGKNPKEITKQTTRLNEVILRAMECIGCGVCIGRCESGALELDGTEGNAKKVNVNVEKCIHCGKCLGPCPVINFNINQSYEL